MARPLAAQRRTPGPLCSPHARFSLAKRPPSPRRPRSWCLAHWQPPGRRRPTSARRTARRRFAGLAQPQTTARHLPSQAGSRQPRSQHVYGSLACSNWVGLEPPDAYSLALRLRLGSQGRSSSRVQPACHLPSPIRPCSRWPRSRSRTSGRTWSAMGEEAGRLGLLLGS
jgi:hypothetical protein